MKMKSSTPRPTHTVELNGEDIKEALVAYLRKSLKGSSTSAPKVEDLKDIQAVGYGGWRQ